ncbi:D-glycerate 3-kinase [Geosmithia morbida]|uniref:D-glycerate 3-kinase n=1 Tax=Geosmithia morbida TaxID=1094350 RepID=A0A9P4Z3Z1_9HYPO|nr:D-glycerate 3-kinase [Geosmithia morbida]KAF4126823.1 D-glycerate 3-kinase [Geosmithia morbida]
MGLIPQEQEQKEEEEEEEKPTMTTFVDDKTPICVPFILEHVKAHQQSSSDGHRPFIIGLNGIQGAGKTTLVTALSSALDRHGLPTLVCSIDDFYLPHADQVALASSHADNALVQHRGEPGTHDLALARRCLDAVVAGQPTRIPVYDKSAFGGAGDRLPESEWRPVNQHGPVLRAVILEGWCVGFRALSDADVECRRSAHPRGSRTLARHSLEHLLFVNDCLRAYDALTDLFDAFVHIDARDLTYVYDWRAQQEDHLRRDKGDPNAGMSPEQIVRFVDGYFPAYELYTDQVRAGVLPGKPGRQLRIVVDQDRRVAEVHRI